MRHILVSLVSLASFGGLVLAAPALAQSTTDYGILSDIPASAPTQPTPMTGPAPVHGPSPLPEPPRSVSSLSLQIIDSADMPALQRPTGDVETDHTLRPGDIIVTVEGLMVFRGWSAGGSAFVPLSDTRVAPSEASLLGLIDRQVKGENRARAMARWEGKAASRIDGGRPRPVPVPIIDERGLR